MLPLNGTGSVDFYGKQRFEVSEKNSLEKGKAERGFFAENGQETEESQRKKLDAHKLADEKTTVLLEKTGIIDTVNKGLTLALKTYNEIKSEIQSETEKTNNGADFDALNDRINIKMKRLKEDLEKISFNGVYPFCNQNSTKSATDDIIDTVKYAEQTINKIEEFSINEKTLQAETEKAAQKTKEIEKSEQAVHETKKNLEQQVNEISKDTTESNKESGENFKQKAMDAIMKNPEESKKVQIKSLESDVILALINVIR